MKISPLFLVLCLLSTACTSTSQQPGTTSPKHDPFDVLIANGMIYDGRGGKPYPADIGISGDRIVAIGANLGSSTLRIDAKGKAVAPGFINMLSWSNMSLIEDGKAQSTIRQGVTLEVMGEGWSMGPFNAAMNDEFEQQQVGKDDFKVEWTTLGGYLSYLEQLGVSTNVASFVGATTVRIHEVGYDDRPPTAAELQRMQALDRFRV